MNAKLLASALMLAASIGTLSAPASAQTMWQRFEDGRHEMAGVVTGFTPYRLTLQRGDGDVTTVDLKPGTVIRPTGATPVRGDRVALFGYYSNGTFVVNRVLLR
ncbi:MAG: hypothetical protein JO322_01645 [Candidatus Eremiobacteraeota bacterium]|nr:hypothetical protein [Candidatus Eremiobacteraeota bacterium]